MTDHTVKSFGEQLEALSALVAQMGGLAEAQFAAAIEAIARRDSVAAERAVSGDARIDEIQQEIEDRALKLLALRQPMAVDLRETLAAIKTAAELERIGDLAKNIAKRAMVLNREPPIRLTQSLARMGRAALSQLKQVLDAYSSRNAELAEAVWSQEGEIDEIYNSLFRELLTYMMEDPRTIGLCTHLLFVAYNIEREGYRVLESRDGEEALLIAQEEKPDLVLLDWMLPQLSGIEVCRRLRGRQETRNVPIIMLTARGEESDRIRGLDTGADDYLTKPFSMTELLARLRAVMRRIRPSLAPDVVAVGDIEMDRAAHRVRRGGVEVHLGPTEYRLLDHLIQHPGRVFSREQLLDAVWGSDVYVEARTVDVHVGRLRKALNIEGVGDPIRTVRSAGYSLDDTFVM